MALFELTARTDMYLGDGERIKKGEKFRMNFSHMGVRPFNVFCNPHSREQASRQFSSRGIDMSSSKLNGGYWDVRECDDYYKAIEHPQNRIENISTPWKDVSTKIDDVEMKKGCVGLVKDFYDNSWDLHYEEQGIEGRALICNTFYDSVKEQMGISADLEFSPMEPNKAGGFNPVKNKIELNSSFLEKGDCNDLLNTVLHESRHAFQRKAVLDPDSVSIKDNLIDVWKDNLKNYIPPQFDFEAYECQPIEADANYFADSVMKKGQNSHLYA